MTADPLTYKLKEKQRNRTKLKALFTRNPDFTVTKSHIGLSLRKPGQYSETPQSESRLTKTAVLWATLMVNRGRDKV